MVEKLLQAPSFEHQATTFLAVVRYVASIRLLMAQESLNKFKYVTQAYRGKMQCESINVKLFHF